MIKEYQYRMLPKQASSDDELRRFVSQEEGVDVRTIYGLRVLRRSIDARQRTVFVNVKVRVYMNEEPHDDAFVPTVYDFVGDKKHVIVVGAGPGGLFASLRLIELGYCPILLERGKNVHERKKDLAQITRTQKVDGESNYCFGEGGAGAYSDGKLYTRSKKRGSVDKILNVFCQHGASTDILADAHPHIGTDRLPSVIEKMRGTILRCGGEVHFQTKMTGLITDGDRVVGVEAVDSLTGAEKIFRGPVILATGHSARDVYQYLYDNQIEIEAKGIAVGVRLEHPSQLIDSIQYHNPKGRGDYLPSAEYSFVTQEEGRGVYSFCMCPGGFVIPAATGNQQIVVNGMSPANRGTAWSNSGMVVELHPEDVSGDNGEIHVTNGKDENEAVSPLCMMHFQENLERMCWQAGNMQQTAPAQRMMDFVKGKLSYDLPRSSYAPGLISSPLHFWMPQPIVSRLQKAFELFGRMSHGFLTNEAILIGVETRTSSPIRILRDRETLQHVRLEGLYPCGEGAGYAGGIVSAAVDGERCAESVARFLGGGEAPE
jgi:uncharacterized FAD-dependent dehydrogenase